ncbi:unnamed protein product [Lymnaea stagnalis]|uniref:C1q domain-containing protein n=1 Tax=Lymnaea stagnalis TaxID=6523 RepID=A0AAV2ILB2_LYMST
MEHPGSIKCLIVFLTIFSPGVTALTESDRKRVWWGRYNAESQSTTGKPSPAGSASSGQRLHDDKGGYSGFHANSAAGKSGGSSYEADPKYGKYAEKDQRWGESEYRPFSGLDPSESWPEKSSRLTEETCQCDERLKILEMKMEELQEDNSRMNTRMWDTVDVVQGMIKGSSKLGKHKHIVSFSAHAASNIPYLKDAEIIVFDDVLVNNGAAYDPRSGIFTVPVSGVYIFSATIVSGFNSTIETMITLNGQEVARLYSGAHQNRGSGSNTVVLNLREGDDIWVALFYGNGNYVHGKWSSFSGSLLETY